MEDDVDTPQHTSLADYMIIPSRRPAPYRDGPVTGILDDIAEYAADEISG